MTEHHHNLRIEELPHEPEVIRPQVEDRHGDAIAMRLGALLILLPAMMLALATLGDFDAAGGSDAVVPLLLLLTSGLMFRRARELDPDDRW